jgi:hypothetical protein
LMCYDVLAGMHANDGADSNEDTEFDVDSDGVEVIVPPQHAAFKQRVVQVSPGHMTMVRELYGEWREPPVRKGATVPACSVRSAGRKPSAAAREGVRAREASVR